MDPKNYFFFFFLKKKKRGNVQEDLPLQSPNPLTSKKGKLEADVLLPPALDPELAPNPALASTRLLSGNGIFPPPPPPDELVLAEPPPVAFEESETSGEPDVGYEDVSDEPFVEAW